jgi:AraC-like DNA-binding protein
VRLKRLAVAPLSEQWAISASPSATWFAAIVERGRAELALHDRLMPLPVGRALLLSPSVIASAKPQGDAEPLVVQFELEPRARVTELGPANEPLVLRSDASRDGLALGIRRELASGGPASASARARAQALVHLCLAAALDAHASDESAADSSSLGRAQLQPALRYIDEHLAELLPNALLAELAHASESHFIRLFRRVFGRTPARHVQERRVACGADLLRHTDLSIDEIAERCGFANRYHFTRVFAKTLGQPPARFRSERRLGAGSDTAAYAS